MEPSYYRAMIQARNCNEQDVKFLTDSKDKSLNNLAKFINYAKTKESNQYRNTFDILNIGETSISELLTWLFDIENARKMYGEQEYKNSFQYKFCFKFLKEINKQNELNMNIISCSKMKPENDIDILLKAKDNKEEYIYVIENKKNAHFSCTKREKGDNCWTQIEKYYNHIYKNYSSYHKIFIYLCAETSYLNTKMQHKIPPKYLNSTTAIFPDGKELNAENLQNMKVTDFLDKFEFKIIEYSLLIKILYKVLLEDEYSKKHFNQDTGVLSPSTVEDMYKLIETIINMYDISSNAPSITNIKKFFSDENLKKTLKEENIITYEENIKEKYDFRGCPKINFYKCLSCNHFEKSIIQEILCRFVEYFELHCNEGQGKDYMQGYGKIINNQYLFEICGHIYDDEDLIKQIKEYPNIKKIISEIQIWKIQEILNKKIGNNDIYTNEKSKIDGGFIDKEYSKYIKYDNHILKYKKKRNIYIYYDNTENEDKLVLINKKDSKIEKKLIQFDFFDLKNGKVVSEIIKNIKNYFKT